VTHFKFCGPDDISGTVQAKIVKLCTLVECIKYWPIDDTAVGSVVRSHDPLLILLPTIISAERLKRESPDCVCS